MTEEKLAKAHSLRESIRNIDFEIDQIKKQGELFADYEFYFLGSSSVKPTIPGKVFNRVLVDALISDAIKPYEEKQEKLRKEFEAL